MQPLPSAGKGVNQSVLVLRNQCHRKLVFESILSTTLVNTQNQFASQRSCHLNTILLIDLNLRVNAAKNKSEDKIFTRLKRETKKTSHGSIQCELWYFCL